MARVLWVRGSQRTSGRDIHGVYTRRSKAIHGCKRTADFVAPNVINQPFPQPADGWEGIEFPCQSTSTKLEPLQELG